MLFPSVFDDNFDDWFGFSFPQTTNVEKKLYGRHGANLMKTDVKEKDGAYVVDIDLPGFHKEDLKLELKEGNLTISAAKGVEKDEKDEDGKYLRQERYSGSVSRTFFIGKNVHQEDIRAKFENGVLTLNIPKEDPNKVDESKFITID